jgi:hypothetical protein
MSSSPGDDPVEIFGVSNALNETEEHCRIELLEEFPLIMLMCAIKD